MTYTIVETEKGYRVLKDKVIFMDGMQLRFMYDLKQHLIPDLDMISTYFESPEKFQELVTCGLVTVHPQRTPGAGEKKLIQSHGFLFFGVRASVFSAELTEEGNRCLGELTGMNLFLECMDEMDKQIAETLLQREVYHEV